MKRGTPGRTRTCNLQLRKLALLSVELRTQKLDARVRFERTLCTALQAVAVDHSAIARIKEKRRWYPPGDSNSDRTASKAVASANWARRALWKYWRRVSESNRSDPPRQGGVQPLNQRAENLFAVLCTTAAPAGGEASAKAVLRISAP